MCYSFGSERRHDGRVMVVGSEEADRFCANFVTAVQHAEQQAPGVLFSFLIHHGTSSREAMPRAVILSLCPSWRTWSLVPRNNK